MLSRFIKNSLLATIVATGMTVCGNGAMADSIDPLDPGLAPYTLVYGDFTVASLGWAFTATGNNGYFIQSGPGQLSNDVIVGSGPGGVKSVNDGTNAMDQYYMTPNGNGISYFQTGDATSSPDPGPTPFVSQFAGDTPNTWDAQLTALKPALNNGNLVFYFNLNEQGAQNGLDGQDLLLWAKVTLVNPNDSTQNVSFCLGGGPVKFGLPDGSCNPLGITGPVANPADAGFDLSDPKWAYVHGYICVDDSTATPTFLHYGTCNSGSFVDPSTATTVKQNLGANQAAFAAWNLALDQDILNNTGGWQYLQIDWAMTGLDNGYEQLFIGSSTVPQVTPEPTSLTLLGSGLLALGFLARRRSRAKQQNGGAAN